jgi:hypothetical protein
MAATLLEFQSRTLSEQSKISALPENKFTLPSRYLTPPPLRLRAVRDIIDQERCNGLQCRREGRRLVYTKVLERLAANRLYMAYASAARLKPIHRMGVKPHVQNPSLMMVKECRCPSSVEHHMPHTVG